MICGLGVEDKQSVFRATYFCRLGQKGISADQNEEKLDEMEQKIPDAFKAVPLDFFRNRVQCVSSSLQ
jgi:hypothetical protein